MKKIILLIFVYILLIACEGDINTNSAGYISVEGYIEQGMPPYITIMHSLPVKMEYESLDSLINYIIKDAVVDVTVDNKKYNLYIEYRKDATNPYIYTSSEIVGEAGKKYNLDIIYKGKHISATTTIPRPVNLLTISPKQSENDSESLMLMASFVDDNSTKDYYKTFVSSSDANDTFLSSFMGNYDDVDFSTDTINIAILKGRSVHNQHFTPLFKKGESVSVKFCHIGKDAYQYWNEYEKVLTSSRNPLYSVRMNLPSNIDGGLGYWHGYGTTYYNIEVK